MLQSCYAVSTSSVKIVFLNGQYDDFTSLVFSEYYQHCITIFISDLHRTNI